VAVRVDELAPKPATITHVEAAAVPLSGLTAWQALFDNGGLASGQHVLIHGAAGGVGTFAVQLARWRTARVTATCSSRDVEAIRELGADEIVDYRATRFEDVVADVDLVIDTVGGETWERSWEVLRPGGRIVSIAVPRPPDRGIVDDRQAIWFIVKPDRAQLIEIGQLIDDGPLRPIVSAVLPLEKGQDAYGADRQKGPAGKGRPSYRRRTRGRDGIAGMRTTSGGCQMKIVARARLS
jgi:NADPH:quinone reductase-like Zn-dependent oxidoreductase